MSLECNSGWDYFHILYWISPKVTEYLNVSQPSKVHQFLSPGLAVPIGPSAATRTGLDQSEPRERPRLYSLGGVVSSLILHAGKEAACSSLNYF